MEACPSLPNSRSAVLLDPPTRKGLLSQRTAMLHDGGDSSAAAIHRQRTAMVGVLASRTAMMLPQGLGSEETRAPESSPSRWSGVMRAASGAKTTVQSLL